MKKEQKRASRHDVAVAAGVSTALVTYALDPEMRHPVNPQTRERILDAVRKLNYVPSFSGRSLKKRKSYNIALVLPERFASSISLFQLRIFHGICSAINLTDYRNMIFFGFDERLVKTLLERRVDGIIYQHYSLTDVGKNLQNMDFQIPQIYVNCAAPKLSEFVSQVNSDHRKIVLEIAEKMRNSGAKHLAMILCNTNNNYPNYVLSQACQECVGRFPEMRVECFFINFPDALTQGNEVEDGACGPYLQEKLQSWYDCGDFPDAFFSDGGFFQPCIREFAQAHNISIPASRFAEIDSCSSNPEAWVQQPGVIGKTAWAELSRLLEHEGAGRETLVPYILNRTIK